MLTSVLIRGRLGGDLLCTPIVLEMWRWIECPPNALYLLQLATDSLVARLLKGSEAYIVGF